jgi:prepilin-type processing-associated H-X9-DG protein
LDVLACPSDGGAKGTSDPCFNQIGNTSYLFCTGDSSNTGCVGTSPVRGIFGRNTFYGFSNITDGSSNTLAMSEGVVAQRQFANQLNGYWRGGITTLNANPMTCMQQRLGNGYVNGAALGCGDIGSRGISWILGSMACVGCNTVFAPNSIACGYRAAHRWAVGCQSVMPPNSFHPGGVNGVMADGSVRFISETIETGTLTSPAPGSGQSPYGVWGAMGSKDGGEAKSL